MTEAGQRGPSGWEALARVPDGALAIRILEAALAAVEPRAAVSRVMKAEGETLRVGPHSVALRSTTRVWCIAVGKAAAAMARGVVERLDAWLVGGIVVTKHAPDVTIDPRGRLAVELGAHPVPDARSLRAGAAVLELATRVRDEDIVVVAISGGASSLMVAPVPGLSLEPLRTLGAALLRCGASIEEINAVRARLDRLKGGGLRARLGAARVITLVLSDVVDAPLHVVGSGPTIAASEGLGDARTVLARHGIEIPAAIERHLRRAEPGASGPGAHDLVIEVGSNAMAVDAAAAAAQAATQADVWAVERLPAPLRGEAREVGEALARRLRAFVPARPTVLLGGGETTVTVRGGGRGGRNQTLALAAVAPLDGVPNRWLVTLATDGEDGPTDAAGAVVDGSSASRARARGLDVARALDDDDAYPVFEALGDLLRIGPTGTNVCDLVLAIARP